MSAALDGDDDWAVHLDRVTRRFGARTALAGASLKVRRGELHALVGENGAGKSTLMRILAGLLRPDEGELRLFGRPVGNRYTPARAIELGVGMVHQHFMLVPTLSVAENVVLGREPRRGPLGLLLDRSRAHEEVRELGRRFGLEVDPARRVSELSVGEAQRVEILKVLYRGAEVLVLDEPTAVLTPAEVQELLRTVGALCAGGKSAILISHKLDEILGAAGRLTVLRRGETVAELDPRSTTAAEVARAMVGQVVTLPRRTDLETGGSSRPATGGDPRPVRLSLANVTARDAHGEAVTEVSLEIRAGEIVGIAGVEGNGQRQLWEALAGLLPVERGSVTLDGQALGTRSTRDRLGLGLGLVAEDRHRHGLVLELPVADNLVLDRLESCAGGSGWLRLDQAAIDAGAAATVLRFDVRPADPGALAGELSGGNQQKLVVARALAPRGPAAAARPPRALVCAQPTRGVDVGAIARIHQELLDARAAGLAVLLFSAELSELLALCDRIGVLYRGRLIALLEAHEATPERLGRLMLGAAPAAG